MRSDSPLLTNEKPSFLIQFPRAGIPRNIQKYDFLRTDLILDSIGKSEMDYVGAVGIVTVAYVMSTIGPVHKSRKDLDFIRIGQKFYTRVFKLFL